MKNKLLLSSALVGSLVASSISFAETKVTGSLDLSYTAKSAQAALGSDNGFGRESQINISNSGDLNNGMKYAAGFSLEFDGDGSASGAQKSRENIYIDLIAGGITYSVGADHVSNLDSSAVPRVSVPANSVAASSKDYAYAQGASLFNAGDTKQNVKESMGLGVSGSGFTAYYVPQLEDFGGANDGISSVASGGSAYMLNYKGDAGVKGLNLNIGYAKAEKAVSSTFTPVRDVKLQQASASYNFGKITVGAGRIEAEDGVAATSATAKDKSTDDFGVTFAVNDKLSVGLNYAKTDIDTKAEDEKITMAQIGYNLGAIGVAASYMQVDNVKGAANTDDEVFNIRLSTKF